MRLARRFLIASALVVLVFLLPYRFWLSTLGRFLVRSDVPAQADIIVVLAGDMGGNRILTAGELVRKGLAPQALVSGPADFYDLHETDFEIPYAVRRGYPESYFVPLPNDSKSTAAEAEAVIAELRRRKVRRVDIVTSNFHTRRAGSVYRSKAPDLEIRIVESSDRYFRPDAWWTNREARKIFLTEWLKTIGAWLRM